MRVAHVGGWCKILSGIFPGSTNCWSEQSELQSQIYYVFTSDIEK